MEVEIIVYSFIDTYINKYALRTLFHGDQFNIKCQFSVSRNAG